MNLTTLALMDDRLKQRLIRDFVAKKYPAIGKAHSGSRLVRSDGTAERYVYLYGKPTKNNVNGDILGKCLPKTMDMLIEAGLWERYSGTFYDHCPDTAYDRFYPVEDES